MSDRAAITGSAETLHRFVTAINAHDVDAISALLTGDHIFIDSLGNRAQGAAVMASGWRGYFSMCPDYWVRIDRAIAGGDTVLAAGEAGGTIDGIAWRTPAAWKATVRGNRVSEWRVFADNKPVYEILAKRQ